MDKYIDTKKLKDLITSGKKTEFQAELKSAVSKAMAEPLSEEDRGKALVDLAALYMEISNSVDQAYIDSLQDMIHLIKELDANAGKIGDQAKIHEIKKSLKDGAVN